ncbi:MAG: hypothetical protein ACYTG5_19980 [Planctomycetota bacterium]|jgi:hypothetical protein
MSTADSAEYDKRFSANAMASFLQIAAVALLIFVCFQIVRPFLPVLVWGIIISVSLYPTHQALARHLGGREKLSATLLTALGLALHSWRPQVCGRGNGERRPADSTAGCQRERMVAHR